MFKKILIAIVLLVAAYFIPPQIHSVAQIKKRIAKHSYENGDIIFQSSTSRQCKAVKYATHSDISHCGILLKEGSEWYVVEAAEHVQKIKLSKFINRGQDHNYTIKRMRNRNAMKGTIIEHMRASAATQIGKHYDLYFNWSNNEMYCSELVWKLYNEAGIKLCATRKLKDFDLSNPLVVTMMKERYGDKIPYEEAVVAPSDIYTSELLKTVEEK